MNIGPIEPYNGVDVDTECPDCGETLSEERQQSAWGVTKCDDCFAEWRSNR